MIVKININKLAEEMKTLGASYVKNLGIFRISKMITGKGKETKKVTISMDENLKKLIHK